MNTLNNIKPISDLGLEIIQHEDHTLLVDKKSKGGKYYFVDNSLGKRIESSETIPSGDVYEIISSTKQLDGIPLLVIESEEEKIKRIALEWFVNVDKREISFDLGWIKIFEAGFNSNKKNYTRDDLIEAYIKGGNDMHNHCIKHDWKGVYQKFDNNKFNELGARYIKSKSKKELHIHVDLIPTKSSIFRENDNAPYGKYKPKIVDNIIYCIWI